MNPAQREQDSEQPDVRSSREGTQVAGQGAQRGRSRSRAPRLRALLLILASAACTQVLDLDGYNFEPSNGLGGSGGSNTLDINLAGSSGEGVSGSDGASAGSGNAGSGSEEPLDDAGTPGGGSNDPDASSGEGGASGSAGAGGVAGAAGVAGAGGYAGSGAAGAAGYAGSGSSGASGLGGSGGGECGVDVCVPDVPSGWLGPLAVSRSGGSTQCPAEYATPVDAINTGLRAGAINCTCGCAQFEPSCRLISETSGEFFDPSFACESPPETNDCMDVVADGNCSASTFTDLGTNSWDVIARSCAGTGSTTACTGGFCQPSASAFGDLCISQSGDLTCPTEFPNRTLYFRNISDTRSCVTCGCFSQDAHCQMDVEICDVGDTLLPGLVDGNSFCLNSSDGDGVTVSSPFATASGTCTAFGTAPQGSAVPIDPVTVCCL